MDTCSTFVMFRNPIAKQLQFHLNITWMHDLPKWLVIYGPSKTKMRFVSISGTIISIISGVIGEDLVNFHLAQEVGNIFIVNMSGRKYNTLNLRWG